jgi:hypothetical protein
MEVRGGCGYIEEWSDPRVVRDALLGSIWEGTSNIVALDVLRSIQRNHTLPALDAYLQRLLTDARIPAASSRLFAQTLAQVVVFVQGCVAAADDVDTRRAATALYNITTAIFMAWEAAQAGGDWRRLALAHLVLRHRILPSDPLAARERPEAFKLVARLLEETALSEDEVSELL